MAPMRSRPLREILVPSRRRHRGRESESRLPEAPPLYVWNDYDSFALSPVRDNENCHDEDDDVTSVVTLDQAIDDRLQQDKCPCLPLRQEKQQQQAEEEPVSPTSTTSPSTAISPALTLPPRRPRRCASPLRNPQGIDVANVPLKPLAFVHQQQQPLPSLDRTDHSRNSSAVEIKYDMALPLSEIVNSGKQSVENKNDKNENNNNKVTLVFCIRRTGCGACREHGMQLSALARQMPCVDMMGVVKPEAVPETTLLEFYTDYFSFPLYQDDDWQLYAAMGQPRISLWHMMTTAPRMERRYKQKGIRNIPLGGDLWTNGGLLILDAQQRLRYMYLEQYGDELDMPAIAWAIEQARRPVAAPAGMTCAKDTCSTLSSPWSTTNTSSALPRKPQRRPSPMRRQQKNLSR